MQAGVGRFLLFLVPVFIFKIGLSGQQSSPLKLADSLNKQSEANRYSSPDLSAALAKRALKLAGKDTVQKIVSLVNWSYAVLEQGALDSAVILADSAQSKIKGVTDSSARSALLVLHGYISDYNEKNEEALRYYFDGLALCPDPAHRAAIYNNIGTIYKTMKDIENAKRYFELSYAIGVQMKDSTRQAKCLNNLGGIFFSNGDFPGALKSYYQSLRIREALFDSVGMSSSLSNIAMVYEKQNDLASALMLYQRSLALSLSSKRPFDIVASHINVGNVLFKIGHKKEAFVQLTRAATLSDSAQLHYYSRLAHRSLANYYAETGNYKMAYANYILYASYNDSVLTEVAQKSAKELELRYRTRESSQTIKLLGEQQKAAELEKENNINQLGRQRNLLWVVFLTAIVIILFAILLFQRYRAELKHTVQLEQLVGEKDLLLREIHHRVKNNLQLVSSLLSLQDSYSHGNAKNALQQNQERIHTLSLLHEQLYKSTDLKAISSSEYVSTLLRHISSSFAKKNSAINVSWQIDDHSFDIDQLVPCGLIINELVSNCFKYAFPSGKGTINVSLRVAAQKCTLIVADDGVGMDVALSATKNSLGLRLVQGLSRQLRGAHHSESCPATGTLFRISFPIKETSK